MFKKILAAINIHDRHVFEQALDLAKAHGASLMLLHVLSLDAEDDPSTSAYPASLGYFPELNSQIMSKYQERWKTREEEGIDLLRSLTEEATAAGIATEFSQNLGSPGKTICTIAKTWEADLIVLGRRGISGLEELFVGSSSSYVLHHAPCSVLVVQAA
ncbi:universal stress protein [Pseudanabaena sp. PCC 6802]|uniref:universal stress protein n=1 Tax=Pseudanabaena sp. PCC 6802 TaxID=118173 RepID=UPI00034AC522|nr:universal stress protein [Pseudanabaena sp. PCC 6802]